MYSVFPRAAVSRAKGELPWRGLESRTRSSGRTPKVGKPLEYRKELEPSNKEEQRKKTGTKRSRDIPTKGIWSPDMGLGLKSRAKECIIAALIMVSLHCLGSSLSCRMV